MEVRGGDCGVGIGDSFGGGDCGGSIGDGFGGGFVDDGGGVDEGRRLFE